MHDGDPVFDEEANHGHVASLRSLQKRTQPNNHVLAPPGVITLALSRPPQCRHRQSGLVLFVYVAGAQTPNHVIQ
jgi:hypothetical protein